MPPTQILAIAATLAVGLLAGMSLDQSIKQLPARHRIGVSSFSVYQRAADLGNGIYLYSSFGAAVLILTLAAAISGHSAPLHRNQIVALDVSAGLAILHSITTAFAAPTVFSQRSYSVTETGVLEAIFNKFERWQALRAILQALNFAAAIWATVALS